MSKIREARASFLNESRLGSRLSIDHIETITIALTALERMQGVDLSYCLKEKGTMPVMSSTQSGMAVVIDSESFKQFQNAARIVADINKLTNEERG